MKLDYPPYEPGEWAKKRLADGKLWECKGLACIVSEARKNGFVVTVDHGDGYPDEYTITSKTARMAVQEMDEVFIYFRKEGMARQWIWVIAENDDDYEWICDHTIGEWFDALIKACTNDFGNGKPLDSEIALRELGRPK